MPIVYLVSNNGKLTKNGSVLLYSDYLGNITKLIPEKLETLIVIGRLEISGPALFLLLERKISVSFFYKNGKYNGQLVFDDPKNVFLRHKQHLLYENQEFVVQTAKDIVRGKLHNEYLYLQRIGRKINKVWFDNEIAVFSRFRDSLEVATTIEAIRGIEGVSAKLYFSLLGNNIDCKWTQFSKRTKNPPRDAVNSVLSFVYTVLANKVYRALCETGLDSAVGSLHALTYGRNSLVFDLVEEYRTPIADALTCAMFNQRVLNAEDFHICTSDESIEEGPEVVQIDKSDFPGVYLTENGMKKVIQSLERKLEQEHMYLFLCKELSYNKIITAQANLYKQLVGGFIDHYQPMVIK